MSPKVIGGSIGTIENLGSILYDFDPKYVTESFENKDYELLLSRIINKFHLKIINENMARSLWSQYCKTLIDAAYFLNSFETADMFYDWCDSLSTDKKTKYCLPILVSMEISGYGLALACDFLKEIGYVEYGKPDTQLKDIFYAIGIIDSEEKSLTRINYSILKVIDRIAESNGITPYEVDKVFWLIGTGNFYEIGKKIGSQKKRFIDIAKQIS